MVSQSNGLACIVCGPHSVCSCYMIGPTKVLLQLILTCVRQLRDKVSCKKAMDLIGFRCNIVYIYRPCMLTACQWMLPDISVRYKQLFIAMYSRMHLPYV